MCVGSFEDPFQDKRRALFLVEDMRHVPSHNQPHFFRPL